MIVKLKAKELRLGHHLWIFNCKSAIRDIEFRPSPSCTIIESDDGVEIEINHAMGKLVMMGNQEVHVYVEDKKYKMGDLVSTFSTHAVDRGYSQCDTVVWSCINEKGDLFARVIDDDTFFLGLLSDGCIIPLKETYFLNSTKYNWKII